MNLNKENLIKVNDFLNKLVEKVELEFKNKKTQEKYNPDKSMYKYHGVFLEDFDSGEINFDAVYVNHHLCESDYQHIRLNVEGFLNKSEVK